MITLDQVRLVATLCGARRGRALPRWCRRATRSCCRCSCSSTSRSRSGRSSARTTFASRGALFQGIRSVPPDWIDRAVGKDADVAAIWTGKTDAHVIWENEFFNRSVGPIYDVGAAPIPGGLHSTAVTVGARRLPARSGGRRLRAPLRARRRLARPERRQTSPPTSRSGLNALGAEPAAPLPDARARASTRTTRGRGPRRHVPRLGCRGGTVRVALLGDPNLFRGRRRRRARTACRRADARPGGPSRR